MWFDNDKILKKPRGEEKNTWKNMKLESEKVKSNG